MEIVLTVLGVVVVAGLAAMTLRLRASRGTVRRSGAAQWRGSAGSARRTSHARPAAAAAGGAGGATAFVSMRGDGSGGGIAVQDPPRTGVDEDAWDDDLEWTDDLGGSPASEPA